VFATGKNPENIFYMRKISGKILKIPLSSLVTDSVHENY